MIKQTRPRECPQQNTERELFLRKRLSSIQTPSSLGASSNEPLTYPVLFFGRYWHKEQD